ncbi:DNA mismatch repair protein Mlh3 [Triplophysa dalaica]|uniref:DNA mismatch repair protein Mlh3 n=1 Tax=Triplophysa dalaica TaxID=1582913 RepID=UPI0024DF9A41|nr:DNA mismatch repair protein Mlh3 [Triplophysa dalaica]
MIRSLPTDVRAQLRSGVTIFSLQQCVEELILNSIDSEATCVAIKMDNRACRLQVIDNGSGMCREDMEKVGIRYNSSKCSTLDDLDNLRFYGFRGEALSSIISLAETVDINSRTKQTVKTYIKTFNEGNESEVVDVRTVRPSSGTTVSIYNLFYNMPVRRKRLDAVLETERIRQRLEAIALMHPSVSFTLKIESSSHMVVQLSKTRNTYYRFVQIHGLSRAQTLGEVSYIHEQFELTGHIGREGHYNNSLQFLFVNGRLVLKTRIHKLLNCLLKRVSSGAKQNNSLTNSASTASPKQRSTADLYGVYVLNIKCNYAEYDICMEPAKSLIEFKDWDNVLTCVEEGVKSFIIKENLETEVMDDADGSTGSPVRRVKTPAEVRKLNVEEKVEGFEALTENKDNADGVDVSGGIQIVVLRNRESFSSEESETDKAVQNVTLPSRTIPVLPVVSEMKNNWKKDCNVICAKKYSTDINNTQLTESKSCKISILNEKSSADSLKYFSTPNKLFSPKRKLLLNDGGRGEPDPHSYYGPCTKMVKTAAPHKLTLSFEAGSLDKFRKLFGKAAEKKHPTMDASSGLHPDSSQKSNDFSEDSSVDVDGLIRTYCENDENNIDSTRDIPGSVSALSKCSAKSSPWNKGDKISLDAKCSHLKQSKVAFKIPQCQRLQPKTLDSAGDVLFESSGTVDSAVNNSLKDMPAVVLIEQSSKIPPAVEDSHLYTSSMTTSGGGLNFGEEAGITSQCDPLSRKGSYEGQTIKESDEGIPVSSNWLAHYDNSLGKLVYINQVTGLSKYNSPLLDAQVPCTTDVTNMVVSVISKTGFEYRCYPFQTNVVLPFLPKPRAERAFCSLMDSKEAVQGPNSLSTLFSEWTNPVFIRPPEVALDVTSGQAEGLAVKIHNILFSYRFTKNMIHTMRVINQVDKKFLACLINATEQEMSKSSKNEGNLLVLVDQHAAHERVRLEGLVADSYEDDPDIPGKKRLCSSSVTPPLEISVTEEEIRLLRSCQAFLSDLALDVSFQKSESLNVFLERLPTCFIEKDSTELHRGRRSVIKSVAEEYLREQFELLRLTGRVRGILPLTVHNVLASQACHGAIKFNHILSKEECCSLVSSLSSCQLPFQCAHGRPSIIPIADLHHIEGQEDLPKPNLRKLRRMYKAWQLYGKDKSLS